MIDDSSREHLSWFDRRLTALAAECNSWPITNMAVGFRIDGDLRRNQIESWFAQNRYFGLGRPRLDWACAEPLGPLGPPPDADRMACELAKAPLQPETTPWRVLVMRLRGAKHLLVLLFHRAVVMPATVRAVVSGFVAFCTNREMVPDDERSRLGPSPEAPPARSREAMEYWRQQLVGIPALNLRADAPRPSRRQWKSAELIQPLGAPLHARMCEMAEAAGTAPFEVFLAGAASFLSRYAAQEDMILGASWSPEPIDLGWLSSPAAVDRVIPFRLSVDTRLSFAEQVQSTAVAAARARSFADTPWDVFQEILGERHPVAAPYDPLMQVLVREEWALPPVTGNAITVSAFSVEGHAADHDLTIVLRRGESPSTVWRYNAELFSEATVREMARSFACMFQRALADPAAPLSKLPMANYESVRRAVASQLRDEDLP